MLFLPVVCLLALASLTDSSARLAEHNSAAGSSVNRMVFLSVMSIIFQSVGSRGERTAEAACSIQDVTHDCFRAVCTDLVGVPAAVEVESLSLSWECACSARRRTHARARWPQRAARPTAASGGYPSSFIRNPSSSPTSSRANSCSWFLVLGSSFLVPRSWFLALGSASATHHPKG